MKKISILIMFTAITATARNSIEIVLPETYELSNIILALTNYGRDGWEVLKSTTYYSEVVRYFDGVKNHPLLDSVNYSLEKWEDYLSFRTDAYAFRFDENNKLHRYIDFYANEGHNPFDKNLDLINDFVEKSNFRQFFQEHKSFYDFIKQNYSNYYFIDRSWEFLENFVGKYEYKFNYLIVLSPLVNRMNCHRNISKNIIADFPSATSEFLNQIKDTKLSDRVNGNHMIFTEMDHGFINPVSDRLKEVIAYKFNDNKWDNGSGYTGRDVFNEYMTWAVWDIFVRENFPEIADSIIQQWQYQNITRGFFAQNIFSEKLADIVKNRQNKLESAYLPLLEWCLSVENNLAIPSVTNFIQGDCTKNAVVNNQLFFSEQMQQLDSFGIIISEMQNGVEIGNSQKIITNNVIWSENGKKASFDIETNFKNFVIVLSYWGISKPLISKNKIFLQTKSYVVVKNTDTKINNSQKDSDNKTKNANVFIVLAIIIGLIAVCAFLFIKK